MKIDSPFLAALSLSCLALAPAAARAERTDRDKPIQLEAHRITVDDAKKVQILEGDVLLTQGTLTLRSDKIVIKEDKYGFQHGTAYGGKDGLARFRQKRDGKDEYVEGEAERIEYNSKDEIAELFNRAWVKTGEDQVKGDYIWYDAVAEKYLVTSSDNRNAKAPPQRVRAIIQPKRKDAEAAEPAGKKSEPLELKGAEELKGKSERE